MQLIGNSVTYRALRTTDDWIFERRILLHRQKWWQYTKEYLQPELGEWGCPELATMYSIHRSFFLQGQLKEAEELGLEILSRRKDILGEDHPDTLRVMGSLIDIPGPGSMDRGSENNRASNGREM